MPNAQYYQIYYCSVPNIKQIYGYYCGPASALQALYGIGLQGSVTGSTDSAKQTTLAKLMGTNSTDGTYVYKERDGLDHYVSTKQYSYTLGSSATFTDFENDIIHSVYNDRPCILHSRTEYLSYYNEHPSGHYISLDGWDDSVDSVMLKDCNNNSAYYGTHTVPATEAKAAVSASSHYYICY